MQITTSSKLVMPHSIQVMSICQNFIVSEHPSNTLVIYECFVYVMELIEVPSVSGCIHCSVF